MKLHFLGHEIYIPVGLVLHYTRRRELASLLNYLDVQSHHVVGDVACGDGYVTRRYAGKAQRVYGNDYNPARIAEAHKVRPDNSHFVVSSAEALPWHANTLDRILSVCSLEHFNDDQQALNEMRRVLKKGGVLAISVDSLSVPGIPDDYRQWHTRQFYVNNYYTLDTLKAKLEKANFELTDWHFLVSSPVSDKTIRFFHRHRQLGFLLFPLAYPLTYLADILHGTQKHGHKLVIRAIAR